MRTKKADPISGLEQKLFKIALITSGDTMNGWAAKVGYKTGYLRRILVRDTHSDKLIMAIRAHIQKHVPPQLITKLRENHHHDSRTHR